MVLPCDWQTATQKVSQRGQHLLETGQWADCKFIVGQEPHQQILEGHKVFFAMSSPVFEAMFYGSMAEKSDPIPIRDVQPEAFKALMEYIYTDKVDLGSFELACELCYCAKKYMLPFLVEECTKFLWSDLSLKKACRAYEFAKLFEEPVLMEKCLQIMCTKTNEVLQESSWEEVEQGTVLTLLDQEDLQISSETDLFNALERWAKAECTRKSMNPLDQKALRSVIGNALTKIRFLALSPQEFAEGPGKSLLLTQQEAFSILMNISSRNTNKSMPEGFSINSLSRAKAKIQDFSERKFNSSPINFAHSFIPQSTSSNYVIRRPFPEDFSGPSNSSMIQNFIADVTPELRGNNREVSRIRDTQEIPNEIIIGGFRDRTKYYCMRSLTQQSDCRNCDTMECFVTFSVDKDIFVLGLQVPSQTISTKKFNTDCHNMAAPFNLDLWNVPKSDTYTEILYANLLDSDETRLSYTHFTTKVNLRELVEISFNEPVYIQKNKMYKIGVVFNNSGWYPIGNCSQQVVCQNVTFTFNMGVNGVDYLRDGLIRSIVFSLR